MSIQSEINRIVGFRNAALAAVAEKGVTVPQGAAIDDLPGLIQSIETGGGGGATCATGTLTPTSNTLTATFDIGSNYDRFILYQEEAFTASVRGLRAAICDFSKQSSTLLLFTTNNTGGGTVGITYYGTGTLSKSGHVVTYSSSNNNLYGGATYRWVAW